MLSRLQVSMILYHILPILRRPQILLLHSIIFLFQLIQTLGKVMWYYDMDLHYRSEFTTTNKKSVPRFLIQLLCSFFLPSQSKIRHSSMKMWRIFSNDESLFSQHFMDLEIASVQESFKNELIILYFLSNEEIQ